MESVVNKKVINATPSEYNGIKFKSLIEVMVYKTLLQNGFEPQYEPNTYIIWGGFKPTIPFYTRTEKTKKQILNLRKLVDITYTPDFYIEFQGLKIIIEAKGFENDVWPYKFKMFRHFLEQQPDKDKYLIFEIFTKKQLLEAITIIKSYGTNTENEKSSSELTKK